MGNDQLGKRGDRGDLSIRFLKLISLFQKAKVLQLL
jgi:hypothetical protein